MADTVGEILRQLRSGRNLSLRALARRANLSHSTLSAWEKETHQPCITELEAVLSALNASSQERQRILAQMQAPRAIAHLRQQAAHEQEAFVEAAGNAPNRGDLLRALRHRAGKTLEETAQRIGVQARTLSRWERSESQPPTHHLHALCFTLNAREEEVVALTCQPFWQREAAPSLADALWEQTQVREKRLILSDLEFLALEARLWPLALRSLRGKQLLMACYAYHAFQLVEERRLTEAHEYAQRSLRLVEQDCLTPAQDWCYAVMVEGTVLVANGSIRQYQRAVRFVRGWFDTIDRPIHRAWMHNRMSIDLAYSGQAIPALEMGRKALELRELAPELGIEDYLMALRGYADTLIVLGQYHAAMDILAETIPLGEGATHRLALQWMMETHCLTGMRDISKAQKRLQQAKALLPWPHLLRLYPGLDELARQLEAAQTSVVLSKGGTRRDENSDIERGADRSLSDGWVSGRARPIDGRRSERVSGARGGAG